LVLVNEFYREYKRLQRPTAAVAKTNHSFDLTNTLRNSSLADDRKVRQYVEELHRYLNVNNREPPSEQPTLAINWLTELEHVQPRKQTVKKQKKNKSPCHAQVTMEPILMHFTPFLVSAVVFPASATYNDRMLKTRKRNCNIKYLVSWKDYPTSSTCGWIKSHRCDDESLLHDTTV